ncbi:MAG: hypothetical protein FJ123_11135 [Deltaproteobacteria bacterium]|nr:hypothetical protein [Deltaproteobacteria bacterium]
MGLVNELLDLQGEEEAGAFRFTKEAKAIFFTRTWILRTHLKKPSDFIEYAIPPVEQLLTEAASTEMPLQESDSDGSHCHNGGEERGKHCDRVLRETEWWESAGDL